MEIDERDCLIKILRDRLERNEDNVKIRADYDALICERDDLYSQQAALVQKMIDLSDRTEKRDEELRRLEEKIEEMAKKAVEKDQQIIELKMNCSEKIKSLRDAQDDLLAIQIELLKLEDGSLKTSYNIKFEREISSPHNFEITCSLGSSNRAFLTGSEDRNIIFYDFDANFLPGMELKWPLAGGIANLALNCDQSLLAAYFLDDKEVVVWSVSTGKVKTTLPLFVSNESALHSTTVSLKFSSLDPNLLWTCANGGVKEWDVTKSLCLQNFVLFSGLNYTKVIILEVGRIVYIAKKYLFYTTTTAAATALNHLSIQLNNLTVQDVKLIDNLLFVLGEFELIVIEEDLMGNELKVVNRVNFDKRLTCFVHSESILIFGFIDGTASLHKVKKTSLICTLEFTAHQTSIDLMSLTMRNSAQILMTISNEREEIKFWSIFSD